MSIILCNNEKELETAINSKKNQELKLDCNIYTEIRIISKFYLGEFYHQKYYLQRVREFTNDFKKIYPNDNDFINSTAVAKINGYIKGYGNVKSLKNEIESLGLSEISNKRLIDIVEGYGR